MKRGTTSTSSLKQLRKERKEEDEARALQEMQKNLEEARAKASATEQKLSGKYDEYCERGPRTVGDHTSSWTKYGRC